MNTPEDPIKEHLSRIEAEVAKIHSDAQYRPFLDAIARLHSYSLNNVALIYSQKPDASLVMGYGNKEGTSGWKALGRHVKKGEKAIKIIAPLGKKERNEDTGEEKTKVYAWRAVNVFDLSQTEGEDLPEINAPVLEDDAGGELYDRLATVAQEDGLTVQLGHPDLERSKGLMGFYQPDQKLIVVRPDVSQLMRTKILAHEQAHHMGAMDPIRDEAETKAESIAYVVLASQGYDSGERSFGYVAQWSKTPEVMKNALTDIHRISTTMIRRLPEPQLSNISYSDRRMR